MGGRIRVNAPVFGASRNRSSVGFVRSKIGVSMVGPPVF